MKRTTAIILAIAMAASMAGCTAVRRLDVPDDELAYSRTLYPDGQPYEESEDEWEEEYLEEEDGEEPAQEDDAAHQAEQPESKQEKKESSKAQSKASSKSSSKAASSKAASSKAASSKAASSKTPKRTTYRQSEMRKNSSGASSAGSDSDTSSASSKPAQEIELVPGTFRASDLYYDAKSEYIYLGDDEQFVRDVLGEPLSEGMDGELKVLVFEDCTITFKQLGGDEVFYVVLIEIPQESYYSTFKRVATEDRVAKVITAYGEPHSITPIYPEEQELEQPGETSEDEQQSDPESEPAEEAADTSADETDTDTDTDTEPAAVEPIAEIYTYAIDDQSFSLRIEHGMVITMEYRWNV